MFVNLRVSFFRRCTLRMAETTPTIKNTIARTKPPLKGAKNDPSLTTTYYSTRLIWLRLIVME